MAIGLGSLSLLNGVALAQQGAGANSESAANAALVDVQQLAASARRAAEDLLRSRPKEDPKLGGAGAKALDAEIQEASKHIYAGTGNIYTNPELTMFNSIGRQTQLAQANGVGDFTLPIIDYSIGAQ